MQNQIESIPGNIGFFYKNLVTGETSRYHGDMPLVAASVIKLPLMMEAFRQFDAGELDLNAHVLIRPESKVPSCGVLTYLHDGIDVTVSDLVTLAIIVSDNTATNLLMDLVGIERVNAFLDAHGARVTRLRRKMFDRESAAKGIQNIITAEEIGMLLEKLYRRELISPKCSTQMINLLKNQQLNGKIPFRFTEDVEIAHKTGEDDHITHDVGIVYTESPFILCICSNHVNVPDVERMMQDIAWELAYDSK